MFVSIDDALVGTRGELCELANNRAVLYYHSLSKTHIVRQLPGTEFDGESIIGCGDLADTAAEDYRRKVAATVQKMSAGMIGAMFGKLNGVPAQCLNKRKVPDLIQ